METVYIVAIVTAAVGILTLAYVFRKRLTRLVVSFQGNSLNLEAEPDRGVTKTQPFPGRGVVLDGTKVDRSTVEADNSPVVAHESHVRKSKIKASESPPSGDQTDG